MVLAAGSGIVGLVMGLRILCQEGDSRGQTTSGIFFLYGETAAGPQSQRGPGGCRGQGPRGRAFRRGEGSGGRGRRPRGGGVAGRRGRGPSDGRGLGAAWVRPHWPSSPGARGPGLLLLIALTGYTVKNAWKNDVFFSWSYFSGWLALPFSILAGNLDSGRRVEETAQRNPSPQTPSRPPGDSSTHSAPDSRRPGRGALGAPNPSPRGTPSHLPQDPPSPTRPPLPSRQASAFCWRT